MNQRPLFAVFAAVVALVGSPAFAEETKNKDDGQDLIERVVVRNRLYDMGGRFELSPSVGFTILNRLTDHYNFNLGVAYNVSNTLAFELRGGYAMARHTALADDLSREVLREDPNKGINNITDDLSGLWEMQGNAAVGVRWAPVYGKIGLLSELPVHFQFYVWGGGGAGNFRRESIVYCEDVASRTEGACASWKTDERVTWLASAAVGFRFFTHQGGGLRLEVRDYAFPDEYREKINRSDAEAGRDTGTLAKSPGLTNLVLFDLGYSFIF
ncbi:MAG: outer membrane beta-barrel domain-containing protein [Myxococcaceae bacterium]